MKAGFLNCYASFDELRHRLSALKEAGCGRILVENHPKADELETLRALMKRLTPGDALVVWSMASVANSMPELVKLILQLEDRDVRFQSLAENFDSGGKDKLVLKALLQQLQRFESSVGRDHAITETGRHRPGRPRALSPQCVSEARQLLKNGVPLSQVAQRFKVSRVTLYRYLDKCSTP